MRYAHTPAQSRQRGVVMVLSLILVVLFSTFAVSMATFSANQAQLAGNQQRVNSALYAAQSGLECAKYIVNTVALDETGVNVVTDTQADKVWTDLIAYLQTTSLDGRTVGASTPFTDAGGAGDQVLISGMNLGDGGADFSLRFYRYTSDTRTLYIHSTGTADQVTRTVQMGADVTKDSDVLNYAIASRGRMWLTGDTTIHGDVFSSWDRADISPFNMTSDSSVEGTINTVLDLSDIQAESYDMETLNAENEPMDVNLDPLGENYADRYYGPDDEVKGYHEGIHYGQPSDDMPGMDISDYNTDGYNTGLSTIPACPSADKEVEYFPHASGNYNYPRDGSPSSTWNLKLTRHVYEDQTFTNARLPDNYNALFRNCTFEEVLYIDCYKSGSSKYNNVRFENCTFNGVIVTDVPQVFKWQQNALYFTGTATFDNTSSIPEATILAPHFNVNLGNTNPQSGDNNILTGAIIGGICDVRGNAQIFGTIISMCDTSQWSSGYVTNIGATLDDGGSETTELGDIGTIEITPAEENMLPSGITVPIVIKPQQNTYYEKVL